MWKGRIRLSINKTIFGTMPDGRTVDMYSLKNAAGMQANIMTYGGTIVNLLVPDTQGALADVVLGYDTLDGYLKGTCFLGTLVGRYANRIGGAKFTLNGKEYHITQNEGKNTLHGGKKGFDKKIWTVEKTEDGKDSSITLSCFSPDGEEGFPGNLKCTVVYTLTADNALQIEYHAVSDADTAINLTNHSYFNVAGYESGSVLSHILHLDAPSFTFTDEESIPTGAIVGVAGTPMDFTAAKPIGKDIHADYEPLRQTRGYDHNFVIAKKEGAAGVQKFAEVYDPKTGRAMEVYTDKPGVQLYTANFLDGEAQGKHNSPLNQYGALCLETQFFPDSVNQPEFPTAFYKAGQEYHFTTVYHFFNK